MFVESLGYGSLGAGVEDPEQRRYEQRRVRGGAAMRPPDSGSGEATVPVGRPLLVGVGERSTFAVYAASHQSVQMIPGW